MAAHKSPKEKREIVKEYLRLCVDMKRQDAQAVISEKYEVHPQSLRQWMKRLPAMSGVESDETVLVPQRPTVAEIDDDDDLLVELVTAERDNRKLKGDVQSFKNRIQQLEREIADKDKRLALVEAENAETQL